MPYYKHTYSYMGQTVVKPTIKSFITELYITIHLRCLSYINIRPYFSKNKPYLSTDANIYTNIIKL